MNIAYIEDFVAQLRADGKALEGDGFGNVGHLKGAYKRVCRQLEEFVEQVKKAPIPEERVVMDRNPDCFGATDNVVGCECRKIFESLGIN